MFQDCYILDTVTSGIFVWIGKHCTKEENVEAMKLAQKFLATNNYPVWTKVRSLISTILKSSMHEFSYEFWPSDWKITVVDE
jgi:hypothetical protein